MRAHTMIQALAPIVSLGIAGCASTKVSLNDALPVSVSAANYSQLSEEEVYARVHAPADSHPLAPAISHPDHPIFYAFVRGESFPSDTPIETVFRELAVPLAHRGYFNVVYEVEAGYRPKRVDYLLRINSGVRRWQTPVVRTDKVTWGNYGLVSGRHDPSSAYVVGDAANVDARAGSDAGTAITTAAYIQTHVAFGGEARNQYDFNHLDDSATTRDYCFIVIEAFKFDDVMKLKNKAPCTWSTFIAVPLIAGQEFSSGLRTMVRTATPYFETTTDGPLVYEVPSGRVLLGNPVEVTKPQPTGQASP